MKLVCVEKCTFRDRLWTPGETLVPTDGEKVPRFFKKEKKMKDSDKRVVGETTKTLYQIAKEEEEENEKLFGIKKEEPEVEEPKEEEPANADFLN